MTRFLSEALEAKEPSFRVGLKRLEVANGNPATDIRISHEVVGLARRKITELGLDPADTTAPELYAALRERLKSDDAKLVKHLRTLAATYVNAEAEPTAGMVEAIKRLPDSKTCFSLKMAKLKSLIKNEPPRKTMRQLGYRSLDSMLKHEPPALILAAAWLSESQAWQRRFIEQYKELKPSDFEVRQIMLLHPSSKRWRELAAQVVDLYKHNLIGFKEIGAVILLPLPKEVPAGTITASLTLAIAEMNQIRVASSFLKLNQVKSDFGQLVRQVAETEPTLSSNLLDQPVPWQLVQRYYARLPKRFIETIFEPYISLEDMVWQPVEKALSSLEPSFKFWHDTAHLGLLHNRSPMSLNLLDNALNLANNLPFEARLSRYFKHSLWHELLLRYLKHQPIEQTISSELQPALVEEEVTA